MNDQAENVAAQSHFADLFLARPFAEQVDNVKRFYLYDRIRAMAAAHQPLLEAGCGPGQWVAWAAAQGWEAIGVDWSAELIERATAQVPDARFLVGDLRRLPLPDESVGSIMSLGAIEHTIEGPEGSLSEFWRVLRPGGMAIVTVPFLGPVRRPVWKLAKSVRYSPAMRRILGKRCGLRPLPRHPGTRPGWTADFLPTENGWSFYQYQIDKPTMRRLLIETGFVVKDEYVYAPEEGLIQTFRRAAGRYTPSGHELSAFGRALQRLLPAGTYEHMLGYSIHKPAA